MSDTTVTKRSLSCAETAKEIRKALKAAFAGVKFSVRSDTYAGGASINIGWTDGPTTAAVDAVVNRFQRADFDGMQDMKVYREDTLVMNLDGSLEEVSYGADFVNTTRDYSAATLKMIAAEIEAVTGTPIDLTKVEHDAKWNVIPGTYNGDGWNGSLDVHVDRDGVIYACDTSEFVGTVVHRALGPRTLA